MPPQPVTPTATPIRQSQRVTPLSALSAADKEEQAKVLREALKKANVPDATADQIVEEQNQFVAFVGEVYYTWTTPNYTQVYLQTAYPGNDPVPFAKFQFPPNDPKYLSEILRADANNFRLHVTGRLYPDGHKQNELATVTVAGRNSNFMQSAPA